MARTTRRRFPFSVPTIAALRRLPLKSRVTFFVGENGTRNFRMTPRAAFFGESQAKLVGELADALTLRWRLRTARHLLLASRKLLRAAVEEVPLRGRMRPRQ